MTIGTSNNIGKRDVHRDPASSNFSAATDKRVDGFVLSDFLRDDTSRFVQHDDSEMFSELVGADKLDVRKSRHSASKLNEGVILH